MNFKLINSLLAKVVIIEGILMLPAALTGYIYKETLHATIYLVLALICIVSGMISCLIKPTTRVFYAREGFVTVSLSWIIMSLIGALPLYVSRDIPSYVDALFEIISGFTTTGSSILSDVEALSHCNLFWRSFSHWLGGMGVLVFILAILPMSGGSTMNLMKAESPGPSVGKLVPKIQHTAFLLYSIYMLLTLIEFILLLIGKMPVFDAICLTFGTAGTGGFGTKNDSIASYSTYLQVVITIFMFLFGVNFTFYYYLLLGKAKDAFHIEEVRWYVFLYVSAVGLITLSLVVNGGTFLESLQQVAFQVASIMTTTGYATCDFDKWPSFASTLMVALMFVGACAGSTGGGMKVSRIVIYIKQVKREFMQQIHPRQISITKMDNKGIEHSTLRSCNVFLMCYATIFVISTLLISINGFDFTTNFTAVTATLNNIGPGLNMVGPTGNFSQFSSFSKIVLMFDMLAGRLEILPIMIILHPKTWKKS